MKKRLCAAVDLAIANGEGYFLTSDPHLVQYTDGDFIKRRPGARTTHTLTVIHAGFEPREDDLTTTDNSHELLSMFHYLWGRAVDGPNYKAEEWREFQVSLMDALKEKAQV